MVRRKAVSLMKGMGNTRRRMLPIPSSGIPITSNLQESLIDNINRIKEAVAQEALSRYNAEDFNSAIVIPNDATYVAHDIVPKQIVKSATQPVKNYTGNQRDFVSDIYNSYYRTLTKGGTSDADARRQAKFLAQKAAYETGYGVHMANTHNYGGHRTKDKGWLSFDSMDDFTERDVKLLDEKWSNWRNSKTDKDFVKAITTNNGQGVYAPENEYKNYYGLSNRVNSYLNMGRRDLRCGGKVRPKAWIGAAVGAATSLLGGILSSNAQERQQEEQRRLQEHNAAIERAQGLTESLGLMQAAQKEYEDRFRLPYSCGGRRRLRYGVRITDGGYAIPIGQNTSLLRGGKHEDINETGQGGIGMKIGGKVVEGEDGEVVQETPKEVRIFSDSIGIDGHSFAELVRMGYDKDKLFKIQQNMNGDYGINSKRRLRNGGSVSRPVERIAYEPGGVVQYSNGMYQKKVKYPNSNRYYWQQISESEYNKLKKQGYTVNKTPQSANAPRQVGDAAREIAEYKRRTASKPATYTGAYKTAVGDGVRGKQDTSFIDSNKFVNGSYSSNRRSNSTTPATKPATTATSAKSSTTQATNKNVNNNNSTVLPETTVLGNGNKGIVYTPNNRKDKKNYSLVSTSPLYNGVNLNGILDIQEAVDRQRRIDASQGNRSTAPITTTPATTSVQPRTKLADVPGYVYDPGYTSQQELDYITGNMRPTSQANEGITPIVVSPSQSAGSATSPENMYLGGYTPKQMEEFMKSGAAAKQAEIAKQAGTNGTPSVNKFGTVFKGVDWASLAADAIGSIGSALINYNAASNIQDPVVPTRVSPGKLITNYNIAPRLAEASMMRGRMLRDSDESFSSAARLNRRNAVNMYTNNYMDKLYGEKTNKEIELLNADTLNQQQVNSQNVAAYNDYMNRLIASRNNRTMAKAAAIQSGISGLGDTVGNLFDQGKQRYSDQQTMRYYSALLPEEGRRYLRRSGIDFLRRGGKIY